MNGDIILRPRSCGQTSTNQMYFFVKLMDMLNIHRGSIDWIFEDEKTSHSNRETAGKERVDVEHLITSIKLTNDVLCIASEMAMDGSEIGLGIRLTTASHKVGFPLSLVLVHGCRLYQWEGTGDWWIFAQKMRGTRP